MNVTQSDKYISLKEEFNSFLEQHQDKIYRICKAYVYYPNLTDDLLQEVLINLWSSLASFKGKSQLTTWAYRVTVNTAISFNKKEKTYQGKNAGEFKGELMDSQEQRSDKLQKEEKLERMHWAISELPKAERLLIGMYLEDISYKEIANILGTSTSHVGVKLNRIKKQLSKKLS